MWSWRGHAFGRYSMRSAAGAFPWRRNRPCLPTSTWTGAGLAAWRGSRRKETCCLPKRRIPLRNCSGPWRRRGIRNKSDCGCARLPRGLSSWNPTGSLLRNLWSRPRCTPGPQPPCSPIWLTISATGTAPPPIPSPLPGRRRRIRRRGRYASISGWPMLLPRRKAIRWIFPGTNPCRRGAFQNGPVRP
ncbi:MAG: hypothetical protein BWX80_01788 [Candidatus Hydrogenedentes bacterium ADurb.Bin101]|nr:MAG: hypothetical protein BWX80_01788 [Candidatus Hydrogenedentes bacterium ADurb.Bin101]